MEFYKKMGIGSFSVAEGSVISVSLARGDILHTEVMLIAALASAAVTIATVYLRNNRSLIFRVENERLKGSPRVGSTERRQRSRRYTARR